MKKILKNYKSTLILVCAIIIGGIIGIIFKDKATCLSPFGDLFLNMLLIIITPLIFLTITTSIGKMKQPKRIGKILTSIIIVFLITSLISLIIGFVITKNVNLINIKDSKEIKSSLVSTKTEDEKLNLLERTVETISTNNFINLLNKDNIIALIIFSILIGLAINMSKEKGKQFLNVLDSANEVLQKFIKIIMYYAPIGLGCYFAALIGSYGSIIALGYIKTFTIYTLICVFIYFAVYSFYAYIAAGKNGIIKYWQNIVPATITALSTCSSSASIPVNTKCTKNIGVPDDIADTTIPLGTSFHKDGSIVGSVFKIMFLYYLFESTIPSYKILLVALIATLLVTAVPIGGGTISEMLIISLMGFPVAALPILTIIATIIDAPATVLNVVGDSASSMLITRIVDGKDWFKSKKV